MGDWNKIHPKSTTEYFSGCTKTTLGGITTAAKANTRGSLYHYSTPAVEIKYIGEELYTLLLSILPYEPVDDCDTRYLNHSHQPVINYF